MDGITLNQIYPHGSIYIRLTDSIVFLHQVDLPVELNLLSMLLVWQLPTRPPSTPTAPPSGIPLQSGAF